MIEYTKKCFYKLLCIAFLFALLCKAFVNISLFVYMQDYANKLQIISVFILLVLCYSSLICTFLVFFLTFLWKFKQTFKGLSIHEKVISGKRLRKRFYVADVKEDLDYSNDECHFLVKYYYVPFFKNYVKEIELND